MTKRILVIPFLAVNAMHVAAYIDDSMMRKFATSNLPTTTWSKGFQTKVQPKTSSSRPKTHVVPVSPKKEERGAAPRAFNVDEIIRAEYDAWTFRYGKAKEDERFEIFRSNFIIQMDFNCRTGQFLLLNEYGDMTAEEYQALCMTSVSTLDDIDVSVAPMGSSVGKNKIF